MFQNDCVETECYRLVIISGINWLIKELINKRIYNVLFVYNIQNLIDLDFITWCIHIYNRA